MSIEPKTKVDQEKMGIALQRLAEEDPTFRVFTDEDTGQTIIAGMGELHLEIIRDRMLREFKVEANSGKPQIAYRETITASATGEGKLIKQSGGRGQYGHVDRQCSPRRARQRAWSSRTRSSAARFPRNTFPPARKAIEEAVLNGVVGGYPVIDVEVDIIDGSYHDVDSNELAFKMAAIFAVKDGFKKASAILLEPIMKVENSTPEEYQGDIMGDLNRRRGQHQRHRGEERIFPSSTPKCRWRKCSATPRRSARFPKAAPATRWSLPTSNKSRPKCSPPCSTKRASKYALTQL